MKQTLISFLKRPTTIVGIAIAVIFQLVFSLTWMTAYDGVTDRADQLHIAFVVEDQQLGQQVAAQLAEHMPFQIEQAASLEIAKERLEERQVQMIVHIPADFTEKASNMTQKANIEYWINESNPATIKSIMGGAASQMNAEVDHQAVKMGIVQFTGQLPGALDGAKIADGLISRVEASMHYTNPVQGMNNQMVPRCCIGYSKHT